MKRISMLAVSAMVIIAASASALAIAAIPFPVRWTAPGDDGLVGRATVYDLRYSTLPITAANFNQASRILGVPAPKTAGSPETFVVSGLNDGVLLYLAIKTADEAGNWSPVSNVLTRPAQTVGVEPELALSFSLPMPNPARQSVRWAYSLPQAAEVEVNVFDAAGRHVHTVTRGMRGAGRGDLTWDLRDGGGRPVSAGLYFVKARLGTMAWTKRLVVVR